MRSFWNGSISFGLVNIPIRLYSAVEAKEASFNFLHKKDLSPVRFARVCKEEEKEIPFADIVRGYQYEKDRYVVVTDEDFKKAAPEKTNSIDIVHFANEDEVDLIYAEQPYYLEPEKRAERSYALLRHALTESGKVAIVRYVLRSRENIGVVKPHGKVLVLNQLRFHNEIRPDKGLNLPAESLVKPAEAKMALALVNQLTEKFRPEKHEDTYTKDLMAAIRRKIKGQPVGKKVAPKKGAQIIDLVEALQASLGKKKKTKAA